MSLFDGKGKPAIDAAARYARLEAQLEAATAENERLRAQVDKLQEALIAKESPIGYEQMKLDQVAARDTPPKSSEEAKRSMVESALLTNRLYTAENDMFKDADDMVDKLSRMLGVPKLESLHSNEES